MKYFRYLDFFDTKFHFYIGGKPTNNTIFGGIMNILFFISCILTFLIFSLEDFKRLNPITTKSEIPGGDIRTVNIYKSKIWIPWRMVTYEEKFIDHRGILHPIVSLWEGRWNDSFGMDLTNRTLNYRLCNETSMANKTEEYKIDVPLNELFCIEEDDLPWGGSWYGDYLYYIEVNLYLCEGGIHFNSSDPRCTRMSDLLQQRNTSWLFEFYYPIVQFQPTNFDVPMAVIYRSYYYRLSSYANKVERIYIQENILNDDKNLLGSNPKNSSCWGTTNIYGDTYFIPEAIDPLVKSTSSRLYSLVIYMDQGYIYYTRTYKKLFSILGDVFPILNCLLLFFKKFTNLVKLTFVKKSTSEILFENTNFQTNIPKRNNFLIPNIFKKERKSDKNNILKNNKSIQNENQNSSNNIFNVDSKQINEIPNLNLISKEYNNKMKIMPSFIKINKSDKNQNINYMNDIKFLGALNSNQLKGKNTVIGRRKNSMILKYINMEFESTKNKTIDPNTQNYLFPTYYYFMDILIDRFIKPKRLFCLNKKYFVVYNFMGQIFDINSHILLIKNFNIFQTIFFNEINGGRIPSFEKKININNENLMNELHQDLNNNTCDIFTKVLLT